MIFKEILVFGTIVVATMGGIIPLLGLLREGQSSNLEKYIQSRQPQSVADVEKLTQEYNRRKDNQFL